MVIVYSEEKSNSKIVMYFALVMEKRRQYSLTAHTTEMSHYSLTTNIYQSFLPSNVFAQVKG
jgi:hypothetical protein